jgi:hypothetical protein
MSGYFVIKTRKKTRTENGNEFLYNKKADKLPEIINFFSKRIIKNDGLLAAPPGIYTWILRDSKNIYASKTMTEQEIGTLHANLDMLTATTDSSPIIAAGEFLKKDDGTFQFNLLSGSYMANKFKKTRGESDSNFLQRILPERNKIVLDVQNIVLPYGIIFYFLECSAINDCSIEEIIGGKNIIEGRNIRTQNANLKELNKMFNRKGGRRKTRKVRV